LGAAAYFFLCFVFFDFIVWFLRVLYFVFCVLVAAKLFNTLVTNFFIPHSQEQRISCCVVGFLSRRFLRYCWRFAFQLRRGVYRLQRKLTELCLFISQHVAERVALEALWGRAALEMNTGQDRVTEEEEEEEKLPPQRHCKPLWPCVSVCALYGPCSLDHPPTAPSLLPQPSRSLFRPHCRRFFTAFPSFRALGRIRRTATMVPVSTCGGIG